MLKQNAVFVYPLIDGSLLGKPTQLYMYVNICYL